MSTTTAGTFDVDPERKSKFRKELEAAVNLDELDKIEKPAGYPFDGTAKIYITHLRRVMMLRLEKIRTPEDVLEAHNYFKSRNIYSQGVQNELGRIAMRVFGEWHPPHFYSPHIRD